MKKKVRVLLFIMVCVMCAAFSGCGGSQEEEIPMGRYADREVKLPPGTFDYMHPCPDGSYYLYGLDTELTYVDAQGGSKAKDRGWEKNANIHVKYEVGVADNGAAVFAYAPRFWNDEELEARWLSGDICYLYFYVDEKGEKHALEPHGEGYQKGTNLNTFAFSPEGELYAASDHAVYRVNVETGEVESLFATEKQVKSMVFTGDVMLAADDGKAYFYDRAEGKLLDGDNAVSREDALRNLNTRLLAGDVPDVIVMDEMDIEQYADKGVLRELDGILQPYLDDGILYQNIVEGMRMTEKNKIYSVPMMVYLPLWLGEKMYLDGEDSLEDIVAGMEKARQKHPEGAILYTLYPKDVLLQTMPVCLPAWTGEDGSLDVEKLTAYYQAVRRMWEIDCAGFDDAGREAWQKNNMEWYAPEDMDMADIGFNFQYAVQQNFGETWLQLGFLMTPQVGMTGIHVTKANMAADWQEKELEDAVAYDAYTGQADNVYWARIIVGLCEQGKEPELAEAYMNLLLSDPMMRKWWLDKPRNRSGLTIRKDSLGDILDIDNIEFGQTMGFKNPTGVNHPNFWPTEEEKQWLYQMMEDASCCYRPGTMLEECAMEVGVRVLEGELTPEEGAKEVERKMAIAMEE